MMAAPNQRDEQGRKTGLWAEPDPHGGMTVGEYVADERHGTWRHHFADGRLRSESHYERGALNGPCVWYRASGGVLQRGAFLDDEKHGTWERWSADGTPLDTTEWDRGKKVRRRS